MEWEVRLWLWLWRLRRRLLLLLLLRLRWNLILNFSLADTSSPTVARTPRSRDWPCDRWQWRKTQNVTSILQLQLLSDLALKLFLVKQIIDTTAHESRVKM